MTKLYRSCLFLLCSLAFLNVSAKAVGNIRPPFQIINWEVLMISKQVHATWKIANDVNVAKYEVEKSVSGTDFTLLKQVSPVRQSIATTYGVIDRTPSKGWNYYRVKITDDQGKISYTSIQKILIKDESKWTFIPSISTLVTI